MAEAQDLHIRLANGSEHVVSLQEDDHPQSVMAEIVTREYGDGEPVEYEWLPTKDTQWVRVEAIDVLWLTDSSGKAVVPTQDVPESREGE
jgi:hypothetical protein